MIQEKASVAEQGRQYALTRHEAACLIRYLQTVFDSVCLVKPRTHQRYICGQSGTLEEGECFCYRIWEREQPCFNCISQRTLDEKKQFSKYIRLGEDTWYILASYVEVDGAPYALETAMNMTRHTVLEGMEHVNVLQYIAEQDRKLYCDSLTGAFNRRYYDEKLHDTMLESGMAVIDVDNFKDVNDRYGHQAGDEAMRMIAQAIFSCIRQYDTLVRYGGDEFVLIFQGMPREAFWKKLEQVRAAVNHAELPGHPDVRMTVSVGGLYGEGRADELFEKADAMMYMAKRERNRVCVQ